MGLGFVVGVFGVVILAHAAYSTIQYRGLLKIMEEEFSGPPMNVVFELLLGFVFCIWAALTVPGKFLSIHPDSEENRYCCLSSFSVPFFS
ncbi:Membrane magnesium transporter [Morella rubra]|uniref:Membrane magnesium transporter n=1 Tax=Morella rubra TaxID=262757 RepID=A0A6A1WIH3_9ROSI|nr:Membrane magnesium transporter [Morella rubra]KAB1223686.1 Membrane magnesium transporter [Morella rubra]